MMYVSGMNAQFMVAVMLMVGFSFFIKDYPVYAHWFGFFLSCYGLVHNDSIQTLGVFITSNAHRFAWWILWGFVAIIFMLTVGVSWWCYDGNVTYERLAIPELEHVSFLQLLAPILLIVLTRMGLPVSTTFLLLSTFVTDRNVIQKIMIKSFLAYVVAFVMTFLVWSAGFNMAKKERPIGKQWFVIQWITSGCLWAVWLVQDGANMSIFLPRVMSKVVLLSFVAYVWLLLVLLFYQKGGHIQKIVNNKTGITDIRRTSVNAFYLLLLFAFTVYNKTPMSTTWMFIGLLGGRELASSMFLIHKYQSKRQRVQKSVYLICRDLLYAMIGLGISIGLSYFVHYFEKN